MHCCVPKCLRIGAWVPPQRCSLRTCVRSHVDLWVQLTIHLVGAARNPFCWVQLTHQSGRLVRTFQMRDFSRFGLHLLKHRRASSTLQSLLKQALDNYPESLGRAMCVCAPTSFQARQSGQNEQALAFDDALLLQVFWKGFSWFMNKRMQEKISLVGYDYHDLLLTHVPPLAVARFDLLNRDPSSSNDGDQVLRAENYDVPLSVTPRVPSVVRVYVSRAGERSRVAWTLGEGDSAGVSLSVTLLRTDAAHNITRDVVVEKRAARDVVATFDIASKTDDVTDGFLELQFESSSYWYSTSLALTIHVSNK